MTILRLQFKQEFDKNFKEKELEESNAVIKIHTAECLKNLALIGALFVFMAFESEKYELEKNKTKLISN